MRFTRVLCVVPGMLLACATPQFPADPMGALRQRAASELSCPEGLLRITALGSETFKDTRQPLYQSVEGCSMHVIYTATEAGYVLSQGARPPPSKAPDHVDVR